MWKKALLNGFVYVWIFVLSLYISSFLIEENFNFLINQNFTIVKIKDYWKIWITINWKDWTERTIYKPVEETSIDDISYFTYNGKQFIVSNNADDFNIWLVSKVKDNNWVLNLYSHNFEKKDTSWAFFYNNWKVWDYITASNWKKYEIYKFNDFKIDKNKPLTYYKENNLSFIYFTCLPNTIEYRRVFFFREK
jgi:hypothetical protein